MKLNVDTFNRLSLGIIEKDKCSPKEALNKLESLKLTLICGEAIRYSVPLQAALITAVNSGKRAFLGGVFIRLEDEIECLLPWPGKTSLNKIIVEVGGKLISQVNESDFAITFGLPGIIDDNRMQLVCNDWQAGILPDTEIVFESTGTIPTAGIFGGAFAVALAFLKESGINISACDQSKGVSLWRPDLHWLDEDAKGPSVSLLPKKYWILGLGHLGQAYLWNIGLLPYSQANKPTILLQDDDKMVEANWSAGLLLESNMKSTYKTRLCSEWLEKRGFETIITERRFDEYTKRIKDEPYLALCGFDSAASRLYLEEAGFDFVVESGLGSNLSTFDLIALHSFPNADRTPKDIWGNDESGSEINKAVYNVLQEFDDEVCGILPLTIAGKTLSASFVGACSGAFVVAELLRGLHGGKRYDKIVFQLRCLEEIKTVRNKKEVYSHEHGRNGYYSI